MSKDLFELVRMCLNISKSMAPPPPVLLTLGLLSMKQECPGVLGGQPQNTPSTHDKQLKKLNMDFVISDTPVMTVTTEAGPRLKHRERYEYNASIYDAVSKYV
jgi:hypothetical protein